MIYIYLNQPKPTPEDVWRWAKNLVQSLNKRDMAIGEVPPGTSLTLRGATVPTGYLLENGDAYATTAYPALFAAIGYMYGGAGASFNVPNSGASTIIRY